MKLKLNNGRGALLCDKCDIIISESFTNEEWAALVKLHKEGVTVLCKECSPKEEEE